MDEIAIRVDGNRAIGSGHLIRCISVAGNLRKLGIGTRFLVADDTSAELLARRGIQAVRLGTDVHHLGPEDAQRMCAEMPASKVVLVDSYAVSQDFFVSLAEAGIRTLYIDDMYLAGEGLLGRPRHFDVDVVVNCGFGVTTGIYRDCYSGSRTRLLIGPSYAPIRDEFIDNTHVWHESVENVLVMSGTTNPCSVLESMVLGCVTAASTATVHVVVGPLASLDKDVAMMPHVMLHENVSDVSPLMREADIAVSAAGTTLFELASVGVPTIAIPIVENQRRYASGFAELGLGLEIDGRLTSEAVAQCVAVLSAGKDLRLAFTSRCQTTVDGRGGMRIAEVLAGMMRTSDDQ